MTTFENWCGLRGVPSLPATPADVARFITDCAPLGIEKLWPIVQEISRAHYLVGLADPTLGGWAAQAVSDIAKIDPPRSWPKDQKARFLQLPYDLQLYVCKREEQREKEIRRAQNDESARQGTAKVTNGIQQTAAA